MLSGKKLDLLFVVDNSGSMGDDQDRLAAGFAQFASTFYMRKDLNICTAIITTDRYLGRTASNGVARERFTDCTNPPGSEAWTESQRFSYTDALIQDFRTKVKVGASGSGNERPGKSLVTFLRDIDQWQDPVPATKLHSFFRADATTNISFLTDESNWFRTTTATDSSNDIPHLRDAVSPQKITDSRKGIQNYLDEFFSALTGKDADAHTYTITSLLMLNSSYTADPGLALNLFNLTQSVGRGSMMGNILGDANAFTSLYEEVGKNVVNQAQSARLKHAFYEPDYPAALSNLSIVLIRAANGQRIPLQHSVDFTLVAPNGVLFTPSASQGFQPGDALEINYAYLN